MERLQEENEQQYRGEISMIDYPRENFNDIGQSLLTTFILINGEDWNHIMNQLINIFKVS